MQSALLFQQSITQELDIIRNRVRQLIGNRHYGEDGRYKEAILKSVIRRFLPANISVGTGFIAHPDFEGCLSSQLDIIIYDNNYPLLFTEGDFIITTTNNVKGIIEVKSKITTGNFDQFIMSFEDSLTEIIQPLQLKKNRTNAPIFFGIFAFEAEFSETSSVYDKSLKNSGFIVNHLSLGPDIFLKKWKQEDGHCLKPAMEATSDFYNFYFLKSLGFSYFISNLVEMVSGELNDRYWFSYPIEDTKESRRVKTVFKND